MYSVPMDENEELRLEKERLEHKVIDLELALKEKISNPDNKKGTIEDKKEKRIDEKIYLLEEEIDNLFLTNETIKPQNRIIFIRDFCKKIGLNLKENELTKYLWEGRKRAKGVEEEFNQDSIIEAPEEVWFWDNILMLQDSNVLSAMPKVGKTTLLIEAIGKWSRGAGEFLGEKFIGECPPVIIIGTDMPKNRWCKLLNKFGLAQSIGEDKWKILDPIKVLFTQNNPVHIDEDGLNKIADLAAKYPKCLFLVDSYSKCCPKGIDERTNHFSEPLADLQEVVAPYNSTLVVIHHSGKAKTNSAVEGARGHTSFTGAVSQCLHMKWLGKDENINDSRVILSSEGRGKEMQMVIQQEDTGWELMGDYAEVIAEKHNQDRRENLNDRQEIVLELCESRSPVHTTYIEVASELKKEEGKVVSDRTCRRALEQLVKLGLLEVKKKVTEQGKENWYFAKKPPKDI